MVDKTKPIDNHPLDLDSKKKGESIQAASNNGAAELFELLHQLRQSTNKEQCVAWIRKEFIPQITELLTSLNEEDSNKITETIIQAVDAITLTGRVRLYLTDRNAMQLICNAVLGPYSNDAKTDPVQIGSKEWVIAEVYENRRFEEIKDTKSDPRVNPNIIERMKLQSTWLFPIFNESKFYKQQEAPDGSCIGILCVDNVYHSHSQPADAEKDLLTELLSSITKKLVSAKKEINMLALQFKIDRLASLHEYLAYDDQEKLLEGLVKVAKDIQSNLSMVVIRLKTPHKKFRLALAEYWPKELGQILNKLGIRVIDYKDSKASEFLNVVADENENKNHVFEYDVLKNYKDGGALHRLINALKEENINLPLGSLLLFYLKNGREFLGVCTFYTKTPYWFPPDEVQFLGLIAKQATYALIRRGMIREREGFKILHECVSQINDKRIPSIDLKRKLSQQLGELYEAESVSFVRVIDDDRLEVECTWPEERIVKGNEEMTFTKNEGISGKAIRTGKSVLMTKGDPDWPSTYIPRVDYDIETSAAIPMKDGYGNVIGALSLESTKEFAFTPNDILLIETVITHIPIVAENANLVISLEEANRALDMAYKELENARWNEAMGNSVSSAVHRVSNIVGSIPTRARELRNLVAKAEDLEGYTEVLRHLTEIEINGRRMLEIAKRLINSGKTPEKEDFEEIVLQECVSSIEAKINLGNTWEHEIAEDFIIYTDRSRLEDILECILENAAIFSKAAKKNKKRIPTVTISSKIENDRYIVDIKDSGEGVPDGLVEELCRTIVNSNCEGNGIGVFVSSRTATMLGGKLYLHDNSRAGATFRLELPLKHIILGDRP